MRHPDYLPTGKPTVDKRRSWGVVDDSQKLGVGIVGMHEGLTMLVALRQSGQCQAVACCDLDDNKLTEAIEVAPHVRTTSSLDEMLTWSEVDIVAIYTPDHLHAEHIEKCFRAGKHVVCTKPLINDPSCAEQLVNLAISTQCRLQVGQSTRFFEPFLQQHEMFAQGVFGEVECYDAHYCHHMDWYYEKSPWSLKDTNWAYLGLSHPIDLVRLYLGDIKTVHAFGGSSSVALSHGLPTSDIVTVNLKSSDGRIGRAFGNYGLRELPKARSLIEGFLMGSKGSSLARYPELRHTWAGDDGTEHEDDYEHAMTGYYSRHELKGMHYGEFCNIIDSFGASIVSGRPNPPDLIEGLQTVLVMESIVRSVRTGQAVDVPHL